MRLKRITATLAAVCIVVLSSGSSLQIQETVGTGVEVKTIVPSYSAKKSFEKSAKKSFEKKEVKADNLSANAISVSCIKVFWKEDGRKYDVDVFTGALYMRNIHVEFKGTNLCYITGLRENSEYKIVVTPVVDENRFEATPVTKTVKTEQVTILQEFEREEGATWWFAGEPASGLTSYPSVDAIEDTIVDPVTGTGARRNEYGDYCCAMGLWYGEVGDRFLITLENGIQFTVMICDSKGMADDTDGDGIADGKFHWFGENGKCIVEFVYDDDNVPECVMDLGDWGSFNWRGLDLKSNILSIAKIGKGSIVEY